MVADENTSIDADAQPGRFQFSMATGLIVVSGLCVVLSLTGWHPLLGGMASSLIVGTWWTRAAVHAGHRRLAYYLAAWPMGVVAFVVGCWPSITFQPSRALSPGQLSPFFPAALLIMCLACLLAILILRRKIRNRLSFGAEGFLSIYLTAALFVVLGGLFLAVVAVVRGNLGLDDVPQAVPFLIGGLVASAVWSTIMSPVAWPVGIVFCKILQGIDPQEIVLADIHRSILRIVDTWQVEKDGPLDVKQVAERLGASWQTAATHLPTLCDLGILQYQQETGYCRLLRSDSGVRFAHTTEGGSPSENES